MIGWILIPYIVVVICLPTFLIVVLVVALVFAPISSIDLLCTNRSSSIVWAEHTALEGHALVENRSASVDLSWVNRHLSMKWMVSWAFFYCQEILPFCARARILNTYNEQQLHCDCFQALCLLPLQLAF
jgi:hypothetical protein